MDCGKPLTVNGGGMGVYERHCCVSYGTVDSWCAVKQSLRELLQLSCFYIPTHNGLVPNVYDKRGLGKGKSKCPGAMLLRYFCLLFAPRKMPQAPAAMSPYLLYNVRFKHMMQR